MLNTIDIACRAFRHYLNAGCSDTSFARIFVSSQVEHPKMTRDIYDDSGGTRYCRLTVGNAARCGGKFRVLAPLFSVNSGSICQKS